MITEHNIYETQTPLNKTIKSFLPDLEDKKITIEEWFNANDIHNTVIAIERILELCNEMTQTLARKHQVIPVFRSSEILIQETGTPVWIPTDFTTELNTEWMSKLSQFITNTLLESKLNYFGAENLKDFFGHCPIYYTLNRMNYPEPYRAII